MWTHLKRLFQSEHGWADQQLSAYLDDELSPSDRVRVEAHLRGCDLCREELRTLRWSVGLTAQMELLTAPRSFLIAEVPTHDYRAPFMALAYLRGATMAVAALLLVVLASDLILPYALAPRMLLSRPGRREAAPVIMEAPEGAGVVKEIPAEKRAEVVVVEKEVVKEVEAETQMEKAAPPIAAPALAEEAEKAVVPMAAPVPAEGAEPAAAPMISSAPGGEILGTPAPTLVSPQMERAAADDRAQKPMPSAASPTEEVSEAVSSAAGDQPETRQQALTGKELTPSLATPSAVVGAIEPLTPVPTYRGVETETARSPRPTVLPPEMSGPPSAEPSSQVALPWRPVLRVVEMVLLSLLGLLVCGMLIARTYGKSV